MFGDYALKVSIDHGAENFPPFADNAVRARP
jgi:hypothetical protein